MNECCDVDGERQVVVVVVEVVVVKSLVFDPLVPGEVVVILTQVSVEKVISI